MNLTMINTAKKFLPRTSPLTTPVVNPNPSGLDRFVPAADESKPLVPVLFLSDLDGTWLSPVEANRRALDEGVVNLKEEAREKGIDLQFGYITARPASCREKQHLPESDWFVCQNGGIIYDGTGLDADWESQKEELGFKASRAREIAEGVLEQPEFQGLQVSSVGEVVANPEADSCPQSATFCIHNQSVSLATGERPEQLSEAAFEAPQQVQHFADQVGQRLKAEGARFHQSPVYPFHGKPYVMFDMACMDKGDAVSYLKEKEHIPPEHVIIAGDGGNDIAMMLDQSGHDDGRRAIVVGSNPKLRQAAQNLQRALLEDPQLDCSLAVLDGVRRHVQAIAVEIGRA
ncbi:MAG: HAD family hydrolase [Vulcanimicrobiota bacterium]